MKYLAILLIFAMGCTDDKWSTVNACINAYKSTEHNIDSLQALIYFADPNSINHQQDIGYIGKSFTKNYQLSVFDNKTLYNLTDEYNRQNLLLNSIIQQIKEAVKDFSQRERDSLQLILAKIEVDRPIIAPKPVEIR